MDYRRRVLLISNQSEIPCHTFDDFKPWVNNSGIWLRLTNTNFRPEVKVSNWTGKSLGKRYSLVIIESIIPVEVQALQ